MTRLSLLVLCAGATLFAGDAGLIDFYVVGSVSCKSQPCNAQVVSVPAVQRVLLDVAAAPRPRDWIARALDGSGVALDALERLKLIHGRPDGYVLDFPLFTASDVRLVRAAAARHARLLADQVLSRRAEIESALAAYDAPGVDRKDVAFVVLGCFSLDWDGLKYLEARGLRPRRIDRPDGRYTPQAEERVSDPRPPEYSRSSSRWNQGLPITIFGDGSGRVDLNRFEPRWSRIHAAMLGLREAPGPELDSAPLLLDAGFVRQVDGRYRSAIPVLSLRDRPMIQRLLDIGRASMAAWFDAHLPALRSELSRTAPERAGVPFAESMAGVWHYIFGQANAILVEEGLFARPRGGSTPVVFAPKLF